RVVRGFCACMLRQCNQPGAPPGTKTAAGRSAPRRTSTPLRFRSLSGLTGVAVLSRYRTKRPTASLGRRADDSVCRLAEAQVAADNANAQMSRARDVTSI